MEASEVKNIELRFIFCNGSKRSEGFAERSGNGISMDGSPEVKNIELRFIFCNGSKRSKGFAERSGNGISMDGKFHR